ncbi:sigma-70 family RNA polymerase sigma factor [uncultured Aquimarina sp.]|uniref:RNA polymerase sigma factor n=1 Tax=uncultured Aquimarina sp. TaxID=575652 RepID=UPI0026216A03|nr:sigma-70 family RNA polymerase sigma factor [uncultured Aquimarina sp.]
MSDEEILNGIVENDRVIIKAFYRDNLKYIRKYIIQNSGNKEDVEDVFQDAMVVLYEKLLSNNLKLTVRLKTYFFGICKNLWKQRLAKKRSIFLTNTLQEGEMQDTTIEDLTNQERGNLYRKYFVSLSLACQQLLELVFEDKSMREIAEITGYSELYCRRKKYKCKKSLMEQIENDPLYDEVKYEDFIKSSL